jgi:methanethiol S-methyltransferase
MTRSLYVIFGVFAYLFFFGTFLYLIAFVGNFSAAPQTVDRGLGASTGAAMATNVMLVTLFGVQHSVMARQGFKKFWTRLVPISIERSIYVLVSSLILWILFAFWRPIPAIVWRVESPAPVAMLWAIFGLGWLIVLLSTFLMSHFELFGLKQVVQNFSGKGPVNPQFRQPFFYRFVRHPLYAGFLLAFWSIPVMTAGHLLFSVAMTIYVLIAIHYEEKDLVGLFGQDYEDYRRKVGKLVPGATAK